MSQDSERERNSLFHIQRPGLNLSERFSLLSHGPLGALLSVAGGEQKLGVTATRSSFSLVASASVGF